MWGYQKLKPLSPEQLSRLSRPRLLAYRNKALSLLECPLSDDVPEETVGLNKRYIWFKSDPRWEPLYSQITKLLSTDGCAILNRSGTGLGGKDEPMTADSRAKVAAGTVPVGEHVEPK